MKDALCEALAPRISKDGLPLLVQPRCLGPFTPGH